jgi:hypothetical protein
MTIITKNPLISNHEEYLLNKTCSNVEELLIKNLPTLVRGGLRKVIKSKAKYPSYWAVDKLNFIQYNTKQRVSLIMLDFDRISDTETIKDRYPTPQLFHEYFLSDYLECNIITETNKGYQALIVLNSHLTASFKKSWYFYKAIKRGLMETIPYIDHIASSRNTGIMRNPLKHNHLVLSLEPSSLEELRDFGEIMRTDLIRADTVKQAKLRTKREQKQANKDFSSSIKPTLKKILLNEDLGVLEGQRKAILFQLGMIKAKPLPYSLVNSLLSSYLYQVNNRYMTPPMPQEELNDIISSVLGYHSSNEIYVKNPLDYKSQKEWNKDYYQKNRKTIKTKEQLKMSRTDHIKKVHEQRKEISKARIIMLLESSSANDYKKKNGKWNSTTIAKFLKMDVRTVRKNLSEISQAKEV